MNRVIRILVGIFVFSGLLLAQSFRGSIRGEVTDPSGAVVPNAKVTVKGVANGVVRAVNSGPDGAYVAAELPAGFYDVTVEATGFQLTKQSNAIVEVGRDTTVDIRLNVVGQDVITVSAAPPLVETTKDVLGEVVDQRLVND